MDRDIVGKALLAVAAKVYARPVDKDAPSAYDARLAYARKVLDGNEAERVTALLNALGVADDNGDPSNEIEAHWDLLAGVDPRHVPDVETMVDERVAQLEEERARLLAENEEARAAIAEERAEVDAAKQSVQQEVNAKLITRDGLEAALETLRVQIQQAIAERDAARAEAREALTERDNARAMATDAEAQAVSIGTLRL